MRTAFVCMTAGLLLSGGSCARPTMDTGPVPRVDCPAGAGSGQPHLAVGRDEKLYLSWIEPASGEGHALRFAIWQEEGWSSARTVASGEGWFVNWADFPSLTAGQDGTLAAHWLVKSGPGTYAYDVVVSTSRDGGSTWSAPASPHRDGTETEHGFASLVPRARGGFAVFWLDGRQTAEEPAGPMTLRFTTLDREGRVAPDRLIDDSVCDCCPTDAVELHDGTVLVVYRDRTGDEIRDIHIARLTEDGISPPRAVHDDGWRIAGCPVNGPAIGARGDDVAVAWFTMPEPDSPRVRIAFSSDGGRSFGAPIRVDGGDPIGRVDVALSEDGSALVSWIERGDGSPSIRMRRVTPAGHREPAGAAAPTSTSRSSGVPQVVRHRGKTFLAWTETGPPSGVATAVAD